MTKYKLYYWLYAFLNKTFGAELEFKRDRLHSLYVVNRHSFNIYSSNTKLENVYSFILDNLSKNYDLTEKESYGFTVNVKKFKKSFHIVVRKVEGNTHYNQREAISVSIY